MPEKILIIAEHDQQTLQQTAVLACIQAALKINSDAIMHLLIAGYQCDTVVKEAQRLSWMTEIFHADHISYAHFLAENVADLLVHFLSENTYTHVIMPATTFGKNILPRVAGKLGIAMIGDVIDIQKNRGSTSTTEQYTRPIYAGNALQIVESHDMLKLITIRPTAFGAPAENIKNTVGNQISITQFLQDTSPVALATFLSAEPPDHSRPDLTQAKIVVAGGRGLGSRENFQLIYDLADCLHAAVGASRAAVDAGFISNDHQVGQTGKIVAPEIYIAIGISGAIQHIAGIKDSKTIIAINHDPDAPIFQIADYGLVANLFTAVPELISALKSI